MDLRGIDVPASESSDGTITSHQRVVAVDALHVSHHAEWRVSLDVRLSIEPWSHSLVKSPSLGVTALSTAVEVLASVFSYPDIQTSLGVEVLDVGLEVISGDVIPMDGNKIDSAFRASTHKVLDPLQTTWRTSRSCHTQFITFLSKRLHIRLPMRNGIRSSHVTLRNLVWFVEEENVFNT